MIISGIKLDMEHLKNLQDTFSILRNSSVPPILSFIEGCPGCNYQQIAKETGIQKDSCHFALAKLTKCNILNKIQDGKQRLYYLNTDALNRAKRIASSISENKKSFTHAYYLVRGLQNTQRLFDLQQISSSKNVSASDLKGKKAAKSKRLKLLKTYSIILEKKRGKTIFLSINKSILRLLQ